MSNAAIKGLVSTIIPVFNRPVLLQEAVQSVLEQTYRSIEIIIVDDGSTDDTLAIAQKICRRYPDIIHVIYQANFGPGLAREAGRLRARGEFIQYLDSDDILLPHKFEIQVKSLNAHPECGISYGKTRHYKRGQQPVNTPWKKTGIKMDYMFPAFLNESGWGMLTPLFRSEVANQIGPWSHLWQHEDWEYDCRFAAYGVKLCYCDQYIADVRRHDEPSICNLWLNDKNALRDRAAAYVLIFHHAIKAGICHEIPEMQKFARQLFFISRLCGTAGLAKESEKLFILARKASGTIRGNGFDFRMYKILANIMGWSLLGKFASYLNQFRK